MIKTVAKKKMLQRNIIFRSKTFPWRIPRQEGVYPKENYVIRLENNPVLFIKIGKKNMQKNIEFFLNIGDHKVLVT